MLVVLSGIWGAFLFQNNGKSGVVVEENGVKMV